MIIQMKMKREFIENRAILLHHPTLALPEITVHVHTPIMLGLNKFCIVLHILYLYILLHFYNFALTGSLNLSTGQPYY